MIPTIKNFTPPGNASPYNPAKTVTVPAGGEAEIKLKGRSADVFGLTRILPYCSDFNGIEIEARLNNERILFEPVQLSAVRELFVDSELLAPLIIQKNNDLRFTLTNTTAAAIDTNIELLGYDGPSLRKLVGMYDDKGIEMPTPVFLFAKEEIAAGAANQGVAIPSKSVDLELLRAAIRTDSDDDMTVSLEIYNETVKNSVFVQQFNDEFSNGRRSFVPIEVGKNVPVTLNASNANVAAQTLSFFGEGYVYEN